jgi:hypothetical protein
MANVIGGSIPNYVKNQIVKRQQLKGSGKDFLRTSNQIQALNSPNAWIKLASGVKINGNTSLAQNNILFGGLSDVSGKQKSTFNEVYGNGTDSFGYVPMPGIEEVTVKHLNNGSIRSAEIKIKAYSKSQFDVLEKLYMRLGFTMLLEWGNSYYVGNNGTYTSMGSTLINSGFYSSFPSKSPTEILILISKKRNETSGNYDAIFGRISNFEWAFNPDGSYDIKLNIISIGDLVESIRIDITPDKTTIDFVTDFQKQEAEKKTEETTETPPSGSTEPPKLEENQKSDQEKESSPTNNRLLAHLFLQKIFYKLKSDAENPEESTEESTEEEDTEKQNNYLIDFKINSEPIGIGNFIEPTGSISIPTGQTTVVEEGFFFDTVREETIDYKPQPTNQKKFDVVYFGYLNTQTQDPSIQGNLNYYMSFGYLLDYIQNYVVPRINKPGKPPLINIDYRFGENLMYYFPNQISLDPRVCVVNSKLKDLTLFSLLWTWISTQNPGAARIMSIYLSFDLIQRSIASNTDEEGKVSLFSFLSTICDELNVALGGVNNLQPIVDEDSNTLKIIDSSFSGKPSTDYKLIIYGYNGDQSSMVRNFDLKTGITSDYAYSMVVGSTSKGYTSGNENTMFSKWNNGITDRYKIEMVPPETSTIDNSPLKNYVDNFYAKGKLALGYKYNGEDIEPELDDKSIDNNISIASEFYKYAQSVVHQKYKKYASPSQGFMSLSLGLTLDGIGGFRIGDSINVDTRIFPADYPTSLRFIIKSVSHKISGQDWETTLDTVVITENAPNGKPVLTPSQFASEVNSLLNSGGISSVKLDETTGNINTPSWLKEVLASLAAPAGAVLGAGGPAIIIGDSQTPAIAQYTTKAKLLGDGKTQGPSTLWKIGCFLVNSAAKDLSLLDFLKAYGTDPSVKYVVINIGTNGGFSNTDAQVKELVDEVKKHFPSAALLAVQGSWGWGGNVSITETQVRNYYAKFAALGVTIIEPPIGDMGKSPNTKGQHPNALTKNDKGQLSFELIGKAIDAAIGG